MNPELYITKPRARTHLSLTPYGHRKRQKRQRTSPAPLRKHSLGGCTIDVPRRTYLFAERYLVIMLKSTYSVWLRLQTTRQCMTSAAVRQWRQNDDVTRPVSTVFHWSSTVWRHLSATTVLRVARPCTITTPPRPPPSPDVLFGKFFSQRSSRKFSRWTLRFLRNVYALILIRKKTF